MNKHVCLFFLVFLVAIFTCWNYSKISADLPSGVKIELFNKYPGQCDDIANNIPIIPVKKMGDVYAEKISFVNTGHFSATKYQASHKNDIVLSSEMRDGNEYIVILSKYGFGITSSIVASR